MVLDETCPYTVYNLEKLCHCEPWNTSFGRKHLEGWHMIETMSNLSLRYLGYSISLSDQSLSINMFLIVNKYMFS